MLLLPPPKAAAKDDEEDDDEEGDGSPRYIFSASGLSFSSSLEASGKGIMDEEEKVPRRPF